MKKIFKSAVFLFLISWCMSCGLIFEENISKKDMTVYTPTDSFVTTNYSVNFKWDPVQDATKYRLQIVSPSFTSINAFTVDTTVTTTTLAITLSPGTYEWRIRAENSGTYTEYYKRSFVVQEGLFTDQYVSLVSPTANYSTYATTVSLKWDTLYSSKEYLIEVDTFTGDYSSPILSTRLPKGTTTYPLTMDKIGSFKWSVKGYNNTDYTMRSERTINFKLSAPTLTGPLNGSTNSLPVNLHWDGLDNVSFLVYIYSADSVTNYDPTRYPYETTLKYYKFDPGSSTNKTYFWSVKTLDKQGNKSDESIRRKIIVQ